MSSLIPAILVLSALILVHELGHFLAARRKGVGVERFSIGFGPRVWGMRRGETEYLLSAVPLGGYVKMVGEHAEEQEGPPPDPAKSFEQKSVWARIVIIAAGPVANFLLAIGIFYLVYLAGVPTLLTKVGTVQANFPAADAGVVPGDTITAIDGAPVRTWEDLTAIVHASAGRARSFTVSRGGQTLTLRITPRASRGTTVFGEPSQIGLIGITPAEEFARLSYGPVGALGMSLSRTAEIVRLTLVGIVKIFQHVVPADTIGGPIMIVQMAGQQAQLGALNLVFFAAFLSISLGLFNLFPIPILDGGQIWFLLIEAVRGRPMSRRVKEVTQQIGLALLVMLMVFAFYNDIMRLIAK